MAGVLAASVVVVYMVAQRLRWTLLGKGAGVLSVIFIGTGLLFLADYADTASGLKMLLLVTLSIVVFALRLYHAITKAPLANWDALASWVGLPFIASVALYFVPTLQTDWNLILLMVVPLLQALFMRKGLTLLFSPSPVRRFARWLTLAALFLLSLMTLSRLGNYAPLPFWPLVHPLTIVCIVAAEPLFRYVRRHRVLRLVWVMWLGAAVTVELNRWLFHYAGIPFDVDAWLESALTQTVWSIVWTLIGGALMITAARLNHSRSRWMVGAIVLGLIVLKLFVLDLVQVDTLYRILSFLGVGGLLLGIGYFAPMPGAKTQQPTPVDHSEDSAVKRN